MKNRTLVLAPLTLAGLAAAPGAVADVVSLQIATTVTMVEGSYDGDILPGHTIDGVFVIDTDTGNAGPGSDPTPSNEPGHEYSSFWEFPGAPYGVSLTIPQIGGSFANDAPVGVVINDNLEITAEETGGLVSDGIYDWIELLGSTTVDYCPAGPGACSDDQLLPADGEEWTLAIFSDTGWFAAGDVIPDALPASYTAFLIGLDFDASGVETGLVIASVDSLSVSAVPVPAAVWLFASGLGLLGFGARQRRQS